MSNRTLYVGQKAIEAAVQAEPELLEQIERDAEHREGNGEGGQANGAHAENSGTAFQSEPERSGPAAFPKAAWRGLFAEYGAEMRRCSEASDAYNFLTLWAAAGNALGRRVWFPYGMRLYPNVYGVAFGPSGDFKTSACRRGAEITETSGGRVVQGMGSGEGIASSLSEEPTLFFLEEFTSLLRQGKWEGSTLLPTLTEIFDCPERYEREYRKNPISLHRPVCSILACTTEAWFWGAVRDSDFEGGFANRFVYLTGPANEPLSLPGVPNLEAAVSAISRLRTLEEQEARFQPQAGQVWERFYRAWRKEKFSPLEGVAVKRIPAYVLKLAMTYAALEGTLPEIQRDQLSAALVVGGYAARCARQLISVRFSGTNAHRELELRILPAVGHSVTTKRDLYRKLHRHYRNAEEFNRVFDSMVRAGILYTKPGEHGRVYVSAEPFD